MDVKTSSLAVGEISAELVETINIIGAKRFNYMMNDAVTEVDDEVFSQKLFQGPIVIENLQIKNFENSPIFGEFLEEKIFEFKRSFSKIFEEFQLHFYLNRKK